MQEARKQEIIESLADPFGDSQKDGFSEYEIYDALAHCQNEAIESAAKKLSAQYAKGIDEVSLMVSRCIQRLKTTYEKLFTDSLTGLLNRDGFKGAVNAEFNRIAAGESKGALVMMIDANHLKAANDKWGHTAGDQMLQNLGKQLQKVCRAGRQQDVAARFSGDEYAMLITDISKDDCRIVLQRIREHCTDLSFKFSELDLPIRFTLGSAFMSINTVSPEEAIKQADDHLTKAKNIARRSYVRGGYPRHIKIGPA